MFYLDRLSNKERDGEVMWHPREKYLSLGDPV